ncbi:hypothetical protein K8R47_00270 [archaeon]|nr:hypothetical protein [archaeon]
MVYTKKVKIKGQDYWYLFHTVRDGDKFLKKSRYLGKELPKNLDEIKADFEEEINKPDELTKEDKIIESLTPLERKVLPNLKDNISVKIN